MSYDTDIMKPIKRLVDCLFSRRREVSKYKIQHVKLKVSI